MLHVLDAQARERPDATWVVVDGEQRLTFARRRPRRTRSPRALEDLGGPCHVGLFMRNQIEFMPSFYGVQAARGVAVPLNADSRGLLLQRVIERADLRAIIARGDQLSVLEELDGLGAVELIVVTSPEGGLPSSVHGARVVEYREWIAGRSDERARALPDSSDVGADPVHLGHDRQLQGRRLPAPLPVPVLGGGLGRAGAHGRRRADDAAAAVPRRGAAHHLQLGAARRLRRAPKSRFSARSYWQEIAEDGATFGIVLGHARGDPAAHRRRGAVASVCAALFCVPFPPGGEEFERRFRVKLLWQGYGMTEVYPHPMPRELEPGQPYDTIGHAAAWIEYGAVDEHDRVLAAAASGRARLPPDDPRRDGARLLQRPRGDGQGVPQLHLPHRRRRLRRCGGARALQRPLAGPDPPPRREHLRGRAGVHRGRSTKRSSSARRTACPASSASTRSSSTSTRATRRSTCASTTRWLDGPAAALHGPAVHRGASPASCPRRRARRSRSSSSPRRAWTARR